MKFKNTDDTAVRQAQAPSLPRGSPQMGTDGASDRLPSRFTAGGFTLLEIVIVLFIMAVFVGVATMSFDGMNEEEVLTKPADELQRVAREAVRRAGMYEEPQVIAFDKRGFGTRFHQEADAGGQNGGSFAQHVDIPSDMSIFMKHWGQTEWQPAAGQVWMVQPSGLCEPVSVRIDRGRSYVEMQFNPLTGGVVEKRLIITP